MEKGPIYMLHCPICGTEHPVGRNCRCTNEEPAYTIITGPSFEQQLVQQLENINRTLSYILQALQNGRGK